MGRKNVLPDSVSVLTLTDIQSVGKLLSSILLVLGISIPACVSTPVCSAKILMKPRQNQNHIKILSVPYH